MENSDKKAEKKRTLIQQIVTIRKQNSIYKHKKENLILKTKDLKKFIKKYDASNRKIENMINEHDDALKLAKLAGSENATENLEIQKDEEKLHDEICKLLALKKYEEFPDLEIFITNSSEKRMAVVI